MLAKGTLVRVRTDEPMTTGDNKILEVCGSLWMVSRECNEVDVRGKDKEPDTILYWCTALATGHEHLWFGYEITPAGGDDGRG